jgi:hypothetical protein|nr:MAG TPA: zinc-ribbon containing domain protein [Caudoviricetes sp.]
MLCPNCKKVIPDLSEQCPECLVNIEAFNREAKLHGTEKRSKFVHTTMIIMIVLSLIFAVIFFIMKLYSIAIIIFIVIAPEIFLFKITETIIDLLQEISQKLDR